jgi:4-hydroxy-3-methylbut-2-en-1-yl diphosphate reductase
MDIFLANPNGFCAGVTRSIDILDEAIARFPGEAIYMKHAIVHNQHVVDSFTERGVKFVESIEEIPDGSVTVLSAHGSNPQTLERARQKNLRVVDTVCPLVLKVHTEAKRYRELGYEIIYIGTPGHAETEGVAGYATGYFHVVTKVDDLRMLDLPTGASVALLTQTTLSVDDTRALIESIVTAYPDIALPKKEDICYATLNRQHAVKVMADRVDTVLVVGSKASSNSNKLVHVAEAAGLRAYLVSTWRDISTEMIADSRAIGITSGASTPEILVKEVIAALEKAGGTYRGTLDTIEETESFTYSERIFAFS